MKRNLKNRSCVSALAACIFLSACGGGGGVSSTPAPNPTPTPTPSPTPTPTPTPTPSSYNTSEYRASDGPAYHGALTAYEDGASGTGVTVGIIDTGIAIGNAEFTGRISPASASFNGEASYQDADGHGTAVATVLAGARNNQKTLGMAWGATIMALRTDDTSNCDEDGCVHPESYIRSALDHAVANGAKAINISLGGDGVGQDLIDAVSRATAAGVIIVIAAGNDGGAAPDGFAASLASPGVSHGLVIIATSNNADDTHSGFTGGGNANGALGYENTTLSALGNEVRAQDNMGTEYLWSGTSLSAPQVTGAVALMLQAFPNLTPQQVVDRLLSTARDAGAIGPDAVFGMGILDVAAAFAPAGATTLGSSKTPLSLVDNGELSSAMGDASGSLGAKAVAIDTLGRAYKIDLQRTLAPGTPRMVLTPLREGPMHSNALSIGQFSGAFSFADVAPRFNRFGERDFVHRPRAFSGTIGLRLSPDMAVGMALSGSAQNITSMLGATPEAATGFLAAQNASISFGFQPYADFAVGLRQKLAGNIALTLSGENGAIAETQLNQIRLGQLRDTRRYQTVAASLDWTAAPLSLSLTGSMLNESDSVLGARLASFFGVDSARTIFADARASLALPGHWSLGLSARRGWTSATHGGHAQIGTLAWSADLSRSGLLRRQDRIGLRIAQPLRVISGGVDSWLPTTHDYATGESSWQMQRINLSPQGREIDMEMSYARPFASGWLSLNGYMRRQPGHIVWADDDFGGALRFTLGY